MQGELEHPEVGEVVLDHIRAGKVLCAVAVATGAGDDLGYPVGVRSAVVVKGLPTLVVVIVAVDDGGDVELHGVVPDTRR